MIICIILLAIGAILTTLYAIEKTNTYTLKTTMLKAMASFFFVALAAYCYFKNNDHSFGFFAICGLASCLLGDIWLGLRHTIKEHASLLLIAGFACFAVGHIFYIVGMMGTLAFPHEWYSYGIPIGGSIVCGILIILLEKPLKVKYGDFKIPCFIYSILLFSTLFTAVYLAIANRFSVMPYNMLFAGAILFSTSDIILCLTYFGENKEKPVFLISNTLTYYVAQYIIAFSLFFI